MGTALCGLEVKNGEYPLENLRLISRLDLKGSNLIKSVNLEGLKIIGDPKEYALKYYNQGADELILIDLVASLYGRQTSLEVIQRICEEVFIPVTVGGGIRSIADAQKLLASGADKIAINTGAVSNPELVAELVDEFGSQSVTISIEAKEVSKGWEVFVENGRQRTGIDVKNWIYSCQKAGVGEILLTSIDKEGTGEGFDLDLLRALKSDIDVPLIVSGGMGKLKDISEVAQFDVGAIAMAHVLHNDILSLIDIRKYANENGVRVRKFETLTK